MPRVNFVPKSMKSPGKCETCGVVIEAGEPYHHWSFRYGGKHVTCGKHTPRQSQLTQSKLSTAYAALEGAFDDVCKWGILDEGEKFVYVAPVNGEKLEVGTENLPAADDLRSILESCKEAFEEVAGEYRDAAEAAPNFAEQSEARADALESAASELENAEFEEFEDWLESNPIEMADGQEIPTEEQIADKIDDWIEEQRGIAEDALNSVEVEG